MDPFDESGVRRFFARYALGATLVAAMAAATSCARQADTTGFVSPGHDSGVVVSQPDAGSNNVIGLGGLGDGSALITGNGGGCASGMCADFPAQPIFDVPDGGGSPVPSNAPALFGSPDASAAVGGPCLYEPAPGALFPKNWLRPRFVWTAPAGQNMFELRFSSPQESKPLVVYTTQTQWTMPADLWTSLAADLQGSTITVSIRGVTQSGGAPAAGTGTSFIIAPAPAEGAMVFWSTASFQTNATSTNLQGFKVGDETTATVLTPPQVAQTVWAQPPDGGNFPQPPVPEPVGCIGCHTATPDGNYVGFTAQWPWPNAIASVAPDAGGVGSAPAWLAAGAIDNLSPNTNDTNYLGGNHVSAGNNVDNVMLGVQTFSRAHFAPGDHVEITSVGASLDDPANSAGQLEGTQSSHVVSQLVWIDLEWNGTADGGRPSASPTATNNGGWGVLQRGGDTNSAGTPSWSHDGLSVAYTSSNEGTMDGRLDMPKAGTNADVKVVPYNARTSAGGAGGTAKNVPGASSAALNEYFPSFSPDDRYIAFSGVAAGQTMYDQPLAEIYVTGAPLPDGGLVGNGSAVKLAANAPAACTGLTSPGVQNTWAKWAPAQAGGVTPSMDGKTYYWVTFSSIRINDPASPASRGSEHPDGGGVQGKVQLYIAGISVDANGAMTTYPAVYLWNQDPTVNNLIPAWDNFSIPPAIGGPPR